ncbi:GNAT family N-acetyltransferase [Levilactobacillus suantsaiihabitans]|uniref:GNAT family N-acetyltransferase n=1 Tax=Levilactobacillus suantsaiihabitans TaxID=2487722 RepID=A0A4Z0J552_9LACO|nr:GNAT family N-acetyltransferase [Levilactobacillus suantsaiihabitans]TGD17526.1 GNAT family N-acetyltransferase [Levilactobacillus suantsaiihabitans]
MEWQTKWFDELSTKDFYNLAYERTRTFVVAQKRVYQEIDDTDLVAHHVLGYDDGQLVAYARIFRVGDHVTFGRVLTIPERRGTGLGRPLMAQIEADLHASFPGVPVSIEAQIDKQHFYEKFGYTARGDVFDFQGTPHIEMTKPGL